MVINYENTDRTEVDHFALCTLFFFFCFAEFDPTSLLVVFPLFNADIHK
jgi:hypothetical protein